MYLDSYNHRPSINIQHRLTEITELAFATIFVGMLTAAT